MTLTPNDAATPSKALQPETQTLTPLACCGPAPLLPGEDAAAYDELLARVSGELKPKGIIEEIWTHEIVALHWENLRWRRHLARFLEAVLPAELEAVLTPLLENAP